MVAIRQGYPAPIAYTYEAGEHCPACAARAFGVDSDGWIPVSARDSEGNPVGAIAPWDEVFGTLACDTCGGIIAEYPDGDEAAS